MTPVRFRKERAAEEFLNILFGLWVTSSISAHADCSLCRGHGGRTPRSCQIVREKKLAKQEVSVPLTCPRNSTMAL